MPLTQSFPIETGVDLDFRPASYVADWCATAAAVQNIAGEERREQVHQRIAAGTLRYPVSARMWLTISITARVRRGWRIALPARMGAWNTPSRWTGHWRVGGVGGGDASAISHRGASLLHGFE